MLKKIFITGCLSLFFLVLQAQSPKIDSLEHLLTGKAKDTGYLKILNLLSAEVSDKNADKAISYAEAALLLSGQLGSRAGSGFALNNLGWAYYRKGDYSKGFMYALQGLHINDSLQNLPQLALSYRNIGAIYNSQVRFKESIDYFQKELKLHQLLGNKVGIGKALNNISYSAFKGKYIDTAERYALMALSVNKVLNDHYLLAFSMRTLGDIALSKGDTEKAIEFLTKSIEEATMIKSNFIIETSLYRLGIVYQKKKDWGKSIIYLLKGLATAEEMGSKGEQAMIYKLLAFSFSSMGEFQKAFEMQSRYSSLNDSLFEKRSRESLAFAQAQFDTEKKQAEISLLKTEDEQQKQKIDNQRLLTFLLLIVMALFISLLLVYRRRNIFKQNANKLLEKQKLELEKVSNQKDKIFSLLSHDLRSPVASLGMLLSLFNNKLLSQEEVDKAMDNLSSQVNSLKDILEDLLLWSKNQMEGVGIVNPVDFYLYEVVAQNQNLLRDMADRKHIRVVNNVPREIMVYADQQHITIIIRNLMMNAIKFTEKGGSVDISIEEQEHDIDIKVADTGIGMTDEQTKKLFTLSTHFTMPGTQNEKGTGLGLLLCKEFVEANHGLIKVISRPKEGSIITVSLPKKKVENN